jgi:hypothetical protein
VHPDPSEADPQPPRGRIPRDSARFGENPLENDNENEKRTRTKTLTREPRTSATRRNEHWDALETVFGYRAEGTERTTWGRVTKSLAAKSATAQSILEAARRYRLDMPDMLLTPTALDKHYSRLMAPTWTPPAASTGKRDAAARLAHQAHQLAAEGR